MTIAESGPQRSEKDMRLHKTKIISAGVLAMAAIACTSGTATAHKRVLRGDRADPSAE
jgi:hypothetical protein